jgi:hypothetical protein
LRLYIKTCKIFILQVLILENEENKMKTRKTVVAVLAAVLLVSAALIVGCMNQLDGITEQDGDSITPPEGQGLFRFKFNDVNPRTILPGSIPAATAMYYDIKFYKGSPTFGILYKTVPATGALAYGSITGGANAIAVDADVVYKIVITAYDTNTKTNALAGWTSSGAHFSVADGGTEGVSADLIGLVDGTQKGNFTYTISYNNTLPNPTYTTTPAWGTRTLDIKGYTSGSSVTGVTLIDGVTPVVFPLDLSVGANLSGTGLIIPTGYYNVIVTLSATNCQDRIIENVMHIYPTLTSTYTPGTIDAPNQNKFTVRFDLNGYTDDETDLNPFGLTDPKDMTNISNAATTEPGIPTDDQGVDAFNGWYANNDGTGTQFVAGVTKVFNDALFYADWIPAGSGDAVISITFSVTDSMTITPTGTGASYDDFKTGSLFKTFTLSGGTFTDIVWKLNGQNVGVGTVFTINAANIDTIAPDLTSGLNVIYVKGEMNGVPYSQAVTLSVSH